MNMRDDIKDTLRRYRFYFMVDVSMSMRDTSRYGSLTPYARLNASLPSLFWACMDLPQLYKRTFVSVLSFSAKADTVMPTTLIDHADNYDTLPDDGTVTN